MEAPPRGPAGESATEIREEVVDGWLPFGIASAKRLLMMHGHHALYGCHQREQFSRVAFGLLRRLGVAWPMDREKIMPGVDQRALHVFLREIVPAKRGGHQSLWIEPTHKLTQVRQFIDRDIPVVADIPFVCQVEIPVAMRLQRTDDRLNGTPVRIRISKATDHGRPIAGTSGERHVDHHPTAITLRHEPLQLLHERLAHHAEGVHRRDFVLKGGPRRPHPDPVHPMGLQVVQIEPNELAWRPQCSVIADSQKKGRLAVERELGIPNSQHRLLPVPRRNCNAPIREQPNEGHRHCQANLSQPWVTPRLSPEARRATCHRAAVYGWLGQDLPSTSLTSHVPPPPACGIRRLISVVWHVIDPFLFAQGFLMQVIFRLSVFAVVFVCTHLAAGQTLTPDVPYVDDGHARHVLDIYVPENAVATEPTAAASLPVVFWIHGGGWQVGDKRDVGLKPQVLTERGFVFVSTNYRLLPDVDMETLTDDVAAALGWVHTHISEYGGDPNRIVVGGHSAGAQLAALLCIDERLIEKHGMPLTSVIGCVPVDGDTYDIPKIIMTAEHRQALYGGEMFTFGHRQKFGNDPKKHVDFSAVTHVAKDKGIPPFLLLYFPGNPDTRAQAQRLAAVLEEAGIPAKAYGKADSNHSRLNDDLGMPDDLATAELFNFLDAVVASKPTGSGTR